MQHRSALFPLVVLGSMASAQYWTPKADFPDDGYVGYSLPSTIACSPEAA
jgi:hypothetical protein